jgi:hypothetical protein
LPSLYPPQPTYSAPVEPYPPFPSAYPLTPPPRTLSLQPLSATAIDIIDAATGYQPFSLPVKEEVQDTNLFSSGSSSKQATLRDALPVKEEVRNANPSSSGAFSSKQPTSRDAKVSALRQALTSTEQPPSRRSRIVSTSEMISQKASKPPDNRRTVSATMATAMKLSAEDVVSTSNQVQPEINGERFITTSQVPRKRLIRGQVDTSHRSRRDSKTTGSRTTSLPSSSKITVGNTAVVREEAVPKKRKVSREASSDSRTTRTSRETSRERNPITRSRRAARGVRNKNTGTSGDYHRNKTLSQIPGSDDFDDGVSTASRRTRSSALASASEAYRTSRNNVL